MKARVVAFAVGLLLLSYLHSCGGSDDPDDRKGLQPVSPASAAAR